MKVYRIQIPINVYHKEFQCGPFNAGCHVDSLQGLCNKYKDQLGWVNEPENDNMTPSIKSMSGLHSGFELKDATIWLPMRGLWKQMYEAGFRICVYDIDRNLAHVGDSQVAFHLDSAILENNNLSYEDLKLLRREGDPHVVSLEDIGLSSIQTVKV